MASISGAPPQGSSAVGSAEIIDDSIVNADINSAAAIAFSKLATLTSANLLIGNASNVATVAAVTGDVTISNSGVTTIGNDKIGIEHLKTGTDGELISYDTSGNPVKVAVGSANQVLTSNGAGAAPTFQAAAGGGNITLMHAAQFTMTETSETEKWTKTFSADDFAAEDMIRVIHYFHADNSDIQKIRIADGTNTFTSSDLNANSHLFSEFNIAGNDTRLDLMGHTPTGPASISDKNTTMISAWITTAFTISGRFQMISGSMPVKVFVLKISAT